MAHFSPLASTAPCLQISLPLQCNRELGMANEFRLPECLSLSRLASVCQMRLIIAQKSAKITGPLLRRMGHMNHAIRGTTIAESVQQAWLGQRRTRREEVT